MNSPNYKVALLRAIQGMREANLRKSREANCDLVVNMVALTIIIFGAPGLARDDVAVVGLARTAVLRRLLARSAQLAVRR